MSIFEGSAVALVTPFTQEGIHFDALKRLLDFQLDNGTDALVICGTTGEPATMTVEEKHAVMQTAIQQQHGRRHPGIQICRGSRRGRTAHRHPLL